MSSPTPHPAIERATLRALVASFPADVRRYMLFQPKNDIQREFPRSPAEERYILGPNKVAKTTTGTIVTIMAATGVSPLALDGAPTRHRDYSDGQHGQHLILAITNEQASGASTRTLERWLPRSWVWKKDSQRKIWTLKRFDEEGAWYEEPGDSIFLKSVQQGRDAIQGNEYDTQWVDEEPTDERVWSELAVMRAPRAGHIIGTITPVRTYERGGVSWLADDIINPAIRGELDPNVVQVFFAKRGDQVNARGDLMTEDELDDLAKKYPNEAERAVRVNGEFVPFTGSPIFDRARLEVLSAGVRRPMQRGDRIRDTFVSSPAGPLAVWKGPEEQHDYVVFSDTSLGDPGADWSFAQVLDRASGEQVARFRARIDPALLAYSLVDLSKWYNDALTGVEANPGGGGSTTISKMLELGFTRLLARPDPPGIRRDGATFMRSQAGGVVEKFGIWTSETMKAEMIAGLRTAMGDGPDGRPGIILHDDVTCAELLTYQRDEKGKIGAAKGRHDDGVMSLMGAVWMIQHTPGARPWVRKQDRSAWSVAARLAEDFVTKQLKRRASDRLTTRAPPD